MTIRAKALMVLGTGSHVGKSLLTAVLCRMLVQEDCRVAPFVINVAAAGEYCRAAPRSGARDPGAGPEESMA